MILAKNVSFGFSRKNTVFENLSFEINAGSICGILGKNGVGKSTLLHHFMGLIHPISGKLEIMNHFPSNRKPSFLREIFFIPEEFDLPPIKISKFVELNSVFYPSYDHSYFCELLREFDVEVDKFLNKLSFGQQKKVMISFGLACNTKILLMDEPTNGLDIPSKSKFRKVVASAITEERLFLISTHQVRDLENLIDQVLILDDKSLVINASLSTISKQLSFKIMNEVPKNAIYSEENIAGISVIFPNETNDESRINLEQLFAAATNKPKEVKQLFDVNSL